MGKDTQDYNLKRGPTREILKPNQTNQSWIPKQQNLVHWELFKPYLTGLQASCSSHIPLCAPNVLPQSPEIPNCDRNIASYASQPRYSPIIL